MAKPKKERFVMQPPSAVYYKPQGIPLYRLEQVILAVEEYEAVRLVDYEGLQQKDAAERMKVSRATCARILESARHKIAAALTGGKAIRIQGGSFVLGRNSYRCRDCSTFWETPAEGDAEVSGTLSCPRCRSERVLDLGREVGRGGFCSANEAGKGGGRHRRGSRGSRGNPEN
jgi:predicted DNA-binding protein (UPF0251 family)/DNA-directed RNA polymerase subunit RPC12/RpoP